MKLKLDPNIAPSFLTYTHTLETTEGPTEVWACGSSETCSFGIIQGQDVVIFTPEELLNLQALVNHAVEILKA